MAHRADWKKGEIRTLTRLLILFLLTGLFAAAANPSFAQVQLPTVNLGDTNFEIGFAGPGWLLEEFPEGYTAGSRHSGTIAPLSTRAFNRIWLGSAEGRVAIRRMASFRRQVIPARILFIEVTGP